VGIILRLHSTLDNVINSQSVKTAATKEQHPQHSLTDYPKLHCEEIAPFSSQCSYTKPRGRTIGRNKGILATTSSRNKQGQEFFA